MLLTAEELTELLQDQESERVERKASASDTVKIREAICALANDLPGYQKPGVIFVGVHDDGRCAGGVIDDRLLLTLGQLRDDGNIQPIPSMHVEKVTLAGCTLAVIQVEPAVAPPVRYQKRTWIRVGPRRAIATPQEEQRLGERRRARDLPFDVRPFSGATLDDLNLDYLRGDYLPQAVAADVLRSNGRSIEQQLTALRLLSPEGAPTPLGLLVGGIDLQRALPGAYVQFTRFDGTDLAARIKDSKKLTGTLPEQLRALEDLLKLQISTSTELVPGRERLKSDYPRVALQELIRNALMHRTYEGSHAPVRIHWFEDRIEIHSPGGVYGQVTPERFGEPGVTDYRNPHVAEAMSILGFAQKFGIGIATARRLLQENGNPPPEFHAQSTHVMALVRRAP